MKGCVSSGKEIERVYESMYVCVSSTCDGEEPIFVFGHINEMIERDLYRPQPIATRERLTEEIVEGIGAS